MNEIYKGMDNAAEVINDNFQMIGKTQLVIVNRDLNLDGVQKVTEFTQVPKYVDIYGIVRDSDSGISIGHVDSSGRQASIGLTLNGETTYGGQAIRFQATSGNVVQAYVTLNDDKTVDFEWIKVGTGVTGEAVIRLIAHY